MKSKVKDILSDLIFQQVTFHLRFTIMDFEIIFGFDFWFGFGTLSPFLQFRICLQYFALVLALMGLALFSYIISILIKLCSVCMCIYICVCVYYKFLTKTTRIWGARKEELDR